MSNKLRHIPQNWTIWDFFRPYFSLFWLSEPTWLNALTSDLKKSRICPIWGSFWPTLHSNLPSLVLCNLSLRAPGRHTKVRSSRWRCRSPTRWTVVSLSVSSQWTAWPEVSGSLRSESSADSPENCHLTVKKLPKTWKKILKNCQKISFF